MLLCGALSFLVCFIPYEDLIEFIISSLHRPDLKTLITGRYFPPDKLIRLQVFVGILSFLSIGFLFYYLKRRHYILGIIKSINLLIINKLMGFLRVFTGLSVAEKCVLGCILSFVLIRSFYYASTFNIQYDEAWNYNYFLKRHVIFSLFAYNNYPLHNLMTWPLVKILSPHVIILRIPSILSGLAAGLVVFHLSHRLTKHKVVSMLFMLLFFCLPNTVFYMLYARGVMMEVFFAGLIIYLLYPFISTGLSSSKRTLIATVFMNGLATLSMLSHVYFIALTTMAMLFIGLSERNREKIVFSIQYGIFALVFSSVLLLPMVLGTGIGSGISAGLSHLNFLALHDAPTQCYSDFISGHGYGIYALMMFNFLLIVLNPGKTTGRLALFNLCLLSGIWLIPGLTQTYPAERTLGFLSLTTITTLCLVFKWILEFQAPDLDSIPEHGHKKRFLGSSILILLAMWMQIHSHHHRFIRWSERLDHEVLSLSSDMMEHHIDRVYNQCNRFAYFVPGIEYYFSLNDRNFNYTTSDSSSTRYVSQKQSKDEYVIDCIENLNPSVDSGHLIRTSGFYLYKEQ